MVDLLLFDSPFQCACVCVYRHLIYSGRQTCGRTVSTIKYPSDAFRCVREILEGCRVSLRKIYNMKCIDLDPTWTTVKSSHSCASFPSWSDVSNNHKFRAKRKKTTKKPWVFQFKPLSYVDRYDIDKDHARVFRQSSLYKKTNTKHPTKQPKRCKKQAKQTNSSVVASPRLTSECCPTRCPSRIHPPRRRPRPNPSRQIRPSPA